MHFGLLVGQNEQGVNGNNLGVNYFGELGLRPGLEIDYGIQLQQKHKIKEDKKRDLSRFLHIRPSLAYYHFSNNSNNFLLSGKLNYQFRFIKKSNQKYFFVEPYVKIGFQRKSFIGEIYQTSTTGFQEVNAAGSNSFILGNGLDLGGKINDRIDWLFGVDYFIELTEDALVLHRFVSKLGTRINLN